MSKQETPTTPLSTNAEPKDANSSARKKLSKSFLDNRTEAIKGKREILEIRKVMLDLKSKLESLKLDKEKLEMDLEEKETELKKAQRGVDQFTLCACGEYLKPQGIKAHQQSCPDYKNANDQK